MAPDRAPGNAATGYTYNKRWRERHPDRRHRWKDAYAERTGRGAYPRRPWTQGEDRAVLAHEISDSALSLQIERSVAAIQTRRTNLKSRRTDA